MRRKLRATISERKNQRIDEQTRKLFLAIRFGSDKRIPALIEAGASLTAMKWNNEFRLAQASMTKKVTAIELAAAAKRWSCVRAIAENAVDIDGKAHFFVALFYAAEAGEMEIMVLLLESGAALHLTEELSYKIMRQVVKHDQPEMLKLLFKYGVKLNVANRFGRAPIMAAAVGGKWACLEVIAESLVEVDGSLFNIPLKCAVEAGETKLAALLLEKGADPRSLYLPLHYAAEKDRPEMLELLLRYKVDPTRGNYGEIPLERANRRNKLRCVEVLKNPLKYSSERFAVKEFLILWALDRGLISNLSWGPIFNIITFVFSGYQPCKSYNPIALLRKEVDDRIDSICGAIEEGHLDLGSRHHLFVKKALFSECESDQSNERVMRLEVTPEAFGDITESQLASSSAA